MDNNIVDAVVKIIQMKGSRMQSMKREGNEHVGLGVLEDMAREREREWGEQEENVFEIKVSSPQSFLIYFVIVLCHGFILIENLYMCLHFENEP